MTENSFSLGHFARFLVFGLECRYSRRSLSERPFGWFQIQQIFQFSPAPVGSKMGIQLILSLLLCTSVHARPVSQRSEVVTDLLTTLFRQTIYHRIENLLLDPGRKSSEKQKIIDSAVDNYHRQKMILPNISTFEQSQEKSETEITTDLTNLTGKKSCKLFLNTIFLKCDISYF